MSLASLESVAVLDQTRSHQVLNDISFTAEPGTLVALVGPSGAGKTTISNLVPRLYDVRGGSVRINGVDVRDATLESLRDTIGVVTQDAHLFHDTIRANLEFVKPDATDADMFDALRAAQILPLIESLPRGLDTVVGDRGYRFSGGEKQRIAIARLLLRSPSIVVLDEATAHLDSESEELVQQALANALRGPHVDRDRAPALDRARRRRDRGHRRRSRGGAGDAPGAPRGGRALCRPLRDPVQGPGDRCERDSFDLKIRRARHVEMISTATRTSGSSGMPSATTTTTK